MTSSAAFLSLVFTVMPTQPGAKADEDPWREDRAQSASAALLAKVEQAEAKAIALLADPKEMEAKPKSTYYAIRFLGEIRSRKGIPALCARLLYEQRVIMSNEPMLLTEQYPAGKALVKIGLPAVEPLLQGVAATATSNVHQKLVADVLAEIFGGKEVVRRVDEYANRLAGKGQPTKDRLKQFLELVKERYE